MKLCSLWQLYQLVEEVLVERNVRVVGVALVLKVALVLEVVQVVTVLLVVGVALVDGVHC